MIAEPQRDDLGVRIAATVYSGLLMVAAILIAASLRAGAPVEQQLPALAAGAAWYRLAFVAASLLPAVES